MSATATAIRGYDYGSDRLTHSPVKIDELKRLLATVDFTEEDRHFLNMAGEILSDQAEEMVNSWRKKIADQDHLSASFVGSDGRPDEQYKAAVKARFVQWVIDTCTRPFDQTWLDYQEEIALRHTPDKKNTTDGAGTPSVVPLRYLIGFSAVVVTSARDFLTAKGHSDEEVNRMSAAWTKAVFLTIALWSRPYARNDLW